MRPSPLPLPPNPFPPSSFQKAYQVCLDLESKAPTFSFPGGSSRISPLVSSRLLGHLLRLAPHEHAQGQLELEINGTKDDDDLISLAEHYTWTFIRTFKRDKGRTPAPSDHSSRPSFEDERGNYMLQGAESNLDHRSAKRWSLVRDGNRCVITGRYDIFTYLRGNFRTATAEPPLTGTEAAHIIPESTNTNIGGSNTGGGKHRHMGGVWAVLSTFGNPKLPEQLNGNNIHRLENILTLSLDLHSYFDALLFWLKPVQGFPNRYTVHSLLPSIVMELPAEVIFTSTQPSLPLPSPDYLALHALCCEVAHMSGAAEWLDEIQKDMEETRVLAKDGSTAHLLSAAISALVVH